MPIIRSGTRDGRWTFDPTPVATAWPDRYSEAAMTRPNQELTDLHMLVLATFMDEGVNSLEDVARMLKLPEAIVRQIAADSEANGLIAEIPVH